MRSAICAASQLLGSGLIDVDLSLYLHVNKNQMMMMMMMIRQVI